MSTEQTSEEQIWDARLAALKKIFGEPAETVDHAVRPFWLGGSADVLIFPHHVPGFTFVTADLTGEDVGQQPNSLGNYELMICTRSDVPAASALISKLALYTCEALLEPGDTMDIGTYFGDSTLRGLLFTHPADGPVQFTLENQPCGLLLCIGITEDELAFKRANDSAALISKLRAAGVFPYTIPDRASVIDPPKGFLRKLFGR